MTRNKKSKDSQFEPLFNVIATATVEPQKLLAGNLLKVMTGRWKDKGSTTL